MHAVN